MGTQFDQLGYVKWLVRQSLLSMVRRERYPGRRASSTSTRGGHLRWWKESENVGQRRIVGRGGTVYNGDIVDARRRVFSLEDSHGQSSPCQVTSMKPGGGVPCNPGKQLLELFLPSCSGEDYPTNTVASKGLQARLGDP